MVCAICGVEVAKARSGLWLHTDAVPKGMPEHDASPQERAAFLADENNYTSLARAAGDMLVHHVGVHPESDCEFAARLRRALGTT